MNSVQCPVCTLYLREGITLKEHLDTHPKDKVIEALVSSSEQKTAPQVLNQPNFQNSFIQTPFHLNNHVQNPVQFSIIQPNPEQMQTAQSVFVPNLISNRRYIVSQPGTIIKVPQRSISNPFCNQIIGTPNYGSPQLQIPARPTHPHILSSSTQNINTQGGPAIIYSQMPAPVQNVPNLEQTNHFQGVQNFQVTPQSQAPVLIPHSNSINTSISSNSQFCNSSLPSFVNSVTPVQSVKTQEISAKSTSAIQVVPNNQLYCNASTQVTTIAIPTHNENIHSISLVDDEQYVKKLYEDVKNDIEDCEQYDYFDENGAYEIEASHYTNESIEETLSEIKEESEYIDDEKSSIEFSSESNTAVQDEYNKGNYENCDRTDHLPSCDKHVEQPSAVVNIENMETDSGITMEEKTNLENVEEVVYEDGEECTDDIHEEGEDFDDEEMLESIIDIDDNDVTLENVDNKDQDKEVDLSTTSSLVNNTSTIQHIHPNENKDKGSDVNTDLPADIRKISNKLDLKFNQTEAPTTRVNFCSKTKAIPHNRMDLCSNNKEIKNIKVNLHSKMKEIPNNRDMCSKLNEIPNRNEMCSNQIAVPINQNDLCSKKKNIAHNHVDLCSKPKEISDPKSDLYSKPKELPVLRVDLCTKPIELPKLRVDLFTKQRMLNRSVVIEPVKTLRPKEEGEIKNQISWTVVPKKVDRDMKHNSVNEITVESEEELDIIEQKPLINSFKFSSVVGEAAYKIKEVMFKFNAFGNSTLVVHKLDIPQIKEENIDKRNIKFIPNISDCSLSKPMPSTSSTPDVTVHLLPKVKTEPDVENKPVNKSSSVKETVQTFTSFSPYNLNQRVKKPVKILQIKNAKKRDHTTEDVARNSSYSCEQPCPSSVIQHPVKTEPPPPPPYDSKHGILPCEPGTSKSNMYSDVSARNSPTAVHFPATDLASVSALPHVEVPTVDISSSKFLSPSLTSPRLQSPSLQDFTDLVTNTKLDRLTTLHHVEYDSVDTPHWLLRGINILPQVIEDDRISCASPKTLLNLDHQTSFQTFEPDDSGSTSINMQTDEMMPPRGELSGQESLESSVWGYQEESGAHQYRQWDEIEPEMDNISNSNPFCTKIEKVEPIEMLTAKIKEEPTISIVPIPPKLEPVAKKRHACIYCNKTFTGWKLRKHHMKDEHPELFNEPETGKLLTKTPTLTSTVISEPSTSFVSQTVSPLKFENSNSFGAQLQEFIPPSIASAKSKERQCITCSEVFEKLKPYQDHIRHVHPLNCPLCSKTFLTKANLTLHMRTHLKIKPYKCDVCEKSFVTAQKLSDHKNTHTGNAPFPCNMCDRHFKRYSNLAQHKKVIHLKKKKIKDFYCHCGEIFQSRGKLHWHQETHASIPKQCTYCSEKFTHTSSLTRHIRKNHDPCYLPVDRKKTDENVNCDICNIVVLKSTLKSHMRIHDTSKPFSCTVCKKSFYTKWNLGLHQWTHVSRTHMPFKCKTCNRGFYSGNEYQAHLRSHRNIRPYTCNFCGRKFIRKFNCIRHVREHELKKKYTCTVCGKTFHRSYYLTAHTRVHNGERPFSCHICGKTSTTKSNHNKHVKTHHARETVNTEG